MTRQTNDPAAQAQLPGAQVTPGVYFCSDGKYRWIYEFDMRKNPTILISVWRVLLLAFGIVMGLMLITQLIEGVMTTFQEYWDFYKWFLVVLGVLMVLAVLAYLVVAASFGWKYVVFFTMDETFVENRPLKAQAEKAKALSWLTVFAGVAAGNIGTVGQGLVAASRETSISVFASVRKVKAVRRRHVIYVNQLLGHNQVYAEDADFAFILDFIASHCPKAKIRR